MPAIPQRLWDDGERIFGRGPHPRHEDRLVLTARPAADSPSAASLERLNHEFALRDELDEAWAVRPQELLHEGGRPLLVLRDPGGEPLSASLGTAMPLERFLRLAIGIAHALARLHQASLLHKDIKPAHIVVDCSDGRPRFTGFGLASRLPRERQAPEAAETLAGTLAYMAPEQTGRMNRSIDSRSDLYALGVTFYQMLTGELPFAASDAMEWVHCHIARQAVAPERRVPSLPKVLSSLVMKLLAKTAEDRYQSAAGVEQDLRRCLADWEAGRVLTEFALDEHSIPDRLLVPEKLYGREQEVASLVAAFERSVSGEACGLLLVSGYSGIGKTSVVSELHKALVPPRGLFASGKFDQYKRDIPYATLVQAFQQLVRMLLGKNDRELMQWRSELEQALEGEGQLLNELIPELRLIIGEQPELPVLEPQQAHRRFLRLLKRFIGVFARPEHPLALFLDDLQWLDAATLDLLDDLLSSAELRHVMLVGAYRSNEIDDSHPLSVTLRRLASAQVRIEEIQLTPLKRQHLEQMIAEALHCRAEQIRPLALLVHEKTAGNPFFAIQFLHALVEEGLLSFDYEFRQWRWDAALIHAKGYTDNVVDLMLGKLARLPQQTQHVLQQLACLGNLADSGTLASVLDMPRAQLHQALWEAIRQELVERQEGAYAFAHDRIHEAAYSLIPQTERAAAHLRIGRLLAAHVSPRQREEAIFEIVGQLNRGMELINAAVERERLAELNLLAGQRAKASAAYAAALSYFATGAELLDRTVRRERRDLLFALELGRAECEFATGLLAAAEKRLEGLGDIAQGTAEQTVVACLLVDIHLLTDRRDQAVVVCLDSLRRLGIDWPPHPGDEAVQEEYERIWTQLAGRPIDQLVSLPPMSNARALACMEILTTLFSPALHTDENLACLTICRAITLSLEHGNSDTSSVAYANIPRIAGRRFGDFQAGFLFGQLGCDLVDRRRLQRYEARTYLAFALFVARWAKPVRDCSLILQRAFNAANRVGDLPFGAFSCNILVSNLFFAGLPLAEVDAEAERSLAYAKKVRFGLVIAFLENQLAMIRMLRGGTLEFGCMDTPNYSEAATERGLENSSKVLACWYWVRKLQARYLAGDYRAALEAASLAEPLLNTSDSFLEEAEYHFFTGLALAASGAEYPLVELCARLSAHRQALQAWARLCPQNYTCHILLLDAQIAHLERRDSDAEALHERAVRSAQESGFLQVEALAYEAAARHYAIRGLDRVARFYWQEARDCFRRWGAEGKVRQLDAMHPLLGHESAGAQHTATIAAPMEQLDLATVLKVLQTVSGEIVLERLVDSVMRTAIEQAGAERGVLLLCGDGQPRIAAQASVDGAEPQMSADQGQLPDGLLSETVLYQVLRTQQTLVLDDALVAPEFAGDPYLRRRGVRSVLCLPLVSQGQVSGALYLENNLTARAFSPARTAVLKLVASQAAISLEKARLYRDVAEREARIRRLVDANIIGIIVWNAEGEILDANDAFLRMLGYQREDLVSRQLRWRDLTPPEFLEESEQSLLVAVRHGSAPPFEKEYFKRDGSRLPVIIGLAPFESGSGEGVAFVLDLSERKRAEELVREGERRYREVQAELAHANRVATMGQLVATIAHEVNQPIAATVTNANAAQRWLDAQPPDLGEVGQVLGRIVRDANRAADVLKRIRELLRKTPSRKGALDINGAIQEMVELTRGQVLKGGVRVHLRLVASLPAVAGDRVELQQVLLNLILNAVEAMAAVEQGTRELEISTQPDIDGGVLVQVCDTGPGFAAENAEQIFAPFYTTKPTGLGMGLSICRSIIEAHGGRLWAAANQPRGAVVQFVVPVHLAEA